MKLMRYHFAHSFSLSLNVFDVSSLGSSFYFCGVPLCLVHYTSKKKKKKEEKEKEKRRITYLHDSY